MTRNEEEVLKVNQMFYDALAARDLEFMSKVWVSDERARCTHPGWTALEGWEAIRQSWENVFDPLDKAETKLSNVTIQIKGKVAWVTCIQQLTYISRMPVGMNLSVSTNIFEKKDDRWLMVVHHASPLPFTPQEFEIDEIDENKIQ